MYHGPAPPPPPFELVGRVDLHHRIVLARDVIHIHVHVHVHVHVHAHVLLLVLHVRGTRGNFGDLLRRTGLVEHLQL